MRNYNLKFKNKFLFIVIGLILIGGFINIVNAQENFENINVYWNWVVGTHFEINNSEYINIVLDSSEIIKLKMDSLPEMITMMIEPSPSTNFTQISLFNLPPLTTFYKYQDDYHNLIKFTTDENGGYTYIQDISKPHLIFIQPRASTKFIKDDATGGDCNFIGIWDISTKTCTLTTNLTETVQIDNDNITFDGNGHAIIGSYTGHGIYLSSRSGVTIKNLNIRNFYFGIKVYFSDNNTILNNIINSNHIGIWSWGFNNNFINNTVNSNVSGMIIGSDNNNLIGNTVNSNNQIGIELGAFNKNNNLINNTVNSNKYGIYIVGSTNNTLVSNVMSDNQYNFWLIIFSSDIGFDNNIDTSNTVDGKPIVYIKDASNQIYDNLTNAGTFYCIKCNNVIIKDLTLTKNGNGILFYKTYNSKIENITALNNEWGIILQSSNNNEITSSIIDSNKRGIYLQDSSNNNLISNTINLSGVEIPYDWTYSGIFLSFSDGNVIINNTISNNTWYHRGWHEISLASSKDNKIYHNNFYHNIFAKNEEQARVYEGINNFFDNGYPDGGNYWSEYIGLDLNNDGIGDTPYTFTSGEDRYPFMKKDGWKIPPGKIFPYKAAELAKEVIDAPYLGDGITWGGKGYDCKTGKFASPTNIKDGYYFYDARIDVCNSEKDKGVDCSGLSFWSYNRAYFGDKIVSWGKCIKEKECPIAGEGADQQYRYNSYPIEKDNLKPGDLLFFDVIKDTYGTVDHVAMYIGEGKVIHAEGVLFKKIIKEDLETVLSRYEKYFKGFARVKEAKKSELQFIAKSPIDLVITDPEGIVITKEMKEAPGMYYYVIDVNEDGELEDIVDVPEKKIGDYLITVIPKLNALPADTYTLEIAALINGVVVHKDLVENVLISDIPRTSYIVRSTETEIIPIIPAFIDFNPDTLNLKSKGEWVTVYIELPIGYNVKDIDLGSIRLNNQIPVELKPTEISDYDKNGIPDLMVKFNRSAVQNILKVGDKAKITVSGKLVEGKPFEGSDTIKLIEKKVSFLDFFKNIIYSLKYLFASLIKAI